jgi:hypothetical protein
MGQGKGPTMSNRVKVLIQHGLGGLAFGGSFYLALSIIANTFLNWFVPFANQRFPFEKPVFITAVYSVALTIYMGLRIPFNAVSTGNSLIFTAVLLGVIGMIAFLVAGLRRGVIIFLALFVLMEIAFVCLTFGMILTG